MVPEPASVALMLLGLGVIGAGRLRARRAGARNDACTRQSMRS